MSNTMHCVARLFAVVAASAALATVLPAQSQDFIAIFDGKTLTNWDGDPTFWRVENGTIVGESTPLISNSNSSIASQVARMPTAVCSIGVVRWSVPGNGY